MIKEILETLKIASKLAISFVIAKYIYIMGFFLSKITEYLVYDNRNKTYFNLATHRIMH